MSSTRHAAANSPFRQERFSSNPRFDRGLMGNLVAKHAALLSDESEIALVWTLQLASWQPGGLAKLAADLIVAFPERLASPLMQKYGCKPGQVYNAKQTAAVRRELAFRRDFSVDKAEALARWLEAAASDAMEEGFGSGNNSGEDKSIPAAEFVAECRALGKAKLETDIANLCLNPDLSFADFTPVYFPQIVATLREHFSAVIKQRHTLHVVTELGRQVWETLDYCQQGGCMVLIDGLARTGKTTAARTWCELRPGTTRYIQCPSSNDDIGFFRAIARACGVSINQNSKAQQLRDRIEDVLQRGHLTVVFDEAHYLWPQSNYREALPNRVNWIMTALVNHGVPVALVTTPQFMRTQKAVERKSCWTSEQFIGRIGHYQKLPDSLSAPDLSAVAKNVLPEGCAKSIETLVVYAQGSFKYLAAIESVVRRARYIAGKSNRQKVVFADIRSAIKESVIPSDAALARALSNPKTARRAGTIPAPQPPVKGPLTARRSGGKETPDLAVMDTPRADRAVASPLAA